MNEIAPPQTFKQKAEFLATASTASELAQRFKRVRAFSTPALAAVAITRATELNILMEHATFLVRLWDRVDAERRTPFGYDAMMRALVQSGQRRRAYDMAKASDEKMAQAWVGVLSAMMPSAPVNDV